ncbi:MAG: prepilin-type N-terminal cleavage/methylation domain-containing protein [Polaromonas sp.]|nr:prepilin-type N-terminal cleavage/methylation domain-containing protein [Polaromonas sp.]
MNNCKAARARTNLQGFTLIEMAMVLVIVGLMMGGIMGALGPQLDNKKVRDTQERIKQASEAIMAFAIANRRLPCPASAASNGDEQFTGVQGACSNFNNGFVPARTLGLGERGPSGVMQDGWGFGIRYAVTQVTYTGSGNPAVSNINCSTPCYPFTQPDGIKNAYYLNGVPGVQPLTANLLQVCASSDGAAATTAVTCGAPTNLVVQPAFVVWSTARNGSELPGGSGPDEAVNLNGNSVYVTHSRTETGATNGAFDDILQWQTVAAVFQNMTNIGILK